MIKIKKKKQLEMILQKIPSHPNPKVNLEQYTTPSYIASDLLWNAYSIGDIEGRNIIDLGCGTGIFAIGSSLLGACKSLGLDIDNDSIGTALKTSNDLNIKNVNFEVLNVLQSNDLINIVKTYNLSYDNNFKVETLFQNPPFGSQEKVKKGKDKKFIDVAMNSAEVIYSFHMLSTEKFVCEYFESKGGIVTHRFRYHFPLPKVYSFHKKETYNVDVIVLRVENFSI